MLDAADTIVWLDLPTRVWLPRLARRTWRRVKDHETLWNGNTEIVARRSPGSNSLCGYALTQRPAPAPRVPAALRRGCPVVRLRSPHDVERWMADTWEDAPERGHALRQDADVHDLSLMDHAPADDGQPHGVVR